jgi:hypothetical protein
LSDRRKAEREQQQRRALEAIRAVQEGADPTDEALRLANEYTDQQTARLFSRFRRKRG